jgi:nucleoid-associated protein YgaU
MKLNHLARLFIMMLVVLGLTVGCASTPDGADTAVTDQATAEQAITDAKSTNAQAKAMGAEWRDTGKIIKQAEAALAAGDYAKATELANKARRQAENAMKQAKAEDSKLKGNGALSASEDDSDSRRGGVIAGDNQYEVVTGDNLWDISGKSEIYDNPYQWPLIYKANRSQIKDADLIYAGQVFDIDRDASADDVDAAVNHAKTRGAWSIGVTEESDKAYLAE